MFLIALGSNMDGVSGGSTEILGRALDALADAGAARIAPSRLYRTPAVPAESGPSFVNGAVRLEMDARPEDVLALLHRIEADQGRTRPARWAPRVCDLDLVAAGDVVLPDAATVRQWMAMDPRLQAQRTPDRLLLPHPRLHERAFVLVPLAEVAPDWVHPLLRKSVVDLLAALPPADRAEIVPL